MRYWSSSARASGIGKWGEGGWPFLEGEGRGELFVLEGKNGVLRLSVGFCVALSCLLQHRAGTEVALGTVG